MGVGERETEVGLDGWCGGCLGQRGGCTTVREGSEGVESPGACVTELVSPSHFCLALCSFRLPSHALVVVTWRGEGCHCVMWLGRTVMRHGCWRLGLRCRVYVLGVYLGDCVCVLSDLT